MDVFPIVANGHLRGADSRASVERISGESPPVFAILGQNLDSCVYRGTLDSNGEALLYPQESGITTGIASIHHQPSSIHHQPSTVYSIDGRPQPALRRGLNLQRQPDGKVRKVLLLR